MTYEKEIDIRLKCLLRNILTTRKHHLSIKKKYPESDYYDVYDYIQAVMSHLINTYEVLTVFRSEVVRDTFDVAFKNLNKD